LTNLYLFSFLFLSLLLFLYFLFLLLFLNYHYREEISALQSNLEYLSNRMLSNEEHMSKLDTTPHDYTSLERDGCHKKPRPPVKVDVNVRLVPKQSKPKVSALNETFVKELDEMAHALNETFVKDSSPELAEIDEQLAQFENAVVDDDGQEQATKL